MCMCVSLWAVWFKEQKWSRGIVCSRTIDTDQSCFFTTHIASVMCSIWNIGHLKKILDLKWGRKNKSVNIASSRGSSVDLCVWQWPKIETVNDATLFPLVCCNHAPMIRGEIHLITSLVITTVWTRAITMGKICKDQKIRVCY